MVEVIVVVGLLICAVQAIRTSRLLHAALWLAGASGLTATLMYMLGAPEVAVIELSVGAGLVTVLFVFAINITGEENLPLQSIIPRPVALVLILVAFVILGWLNRDVLNSVTTGTLSQGFANAVWNDRQLDVYLQIALIFSGVLGVLGLLDEMHLHSPSQETKKESES
jgi:uncharacterized MnhB-related membrane protein